MSDYELEAKEFIERFSEEAQRKAVIAIGDLMESDPRKDWRFIATALKKKSVANWELFGFGLLFNSRFIASVFKQIERDNASRDIDLDAFFSVLDENKDDDGFIL